MDIAKLIDSLFTSAGPGGVVVILVIGTAATVYFMLTRWIVQGGEDDGPGFNRFG